MELSVTVICPSICLCIVVKERTGEESAGVVTPAPSLPENCFQVVGVTGFEPVTLRLSSACSNQLSYRPGGEAAISNFRFKI